VVSLSAEDNVVVLEAEDEGPLVPQEVMLDLLEQRVDPGTFGRPRGISLLTLQAICKHLHNRHQAVITLGHSARRRQTTRIELARDTDPS
jgi:sensor histidine kinase regulating citrate/malate metabolism